MREFDRTFCAAVQHYQAGQVPEAEKLCRHILRDPKNANALNLQGVIAHRAGRNDIAIDLFRQAIASRPKWPEAHGHLGNSLKDSGRLDEAIAAYRQALALKSDYAEALCNLGSALYDKGNLEEAITAERWAIVLEPRFADAYANLGNALMGKGQLDEAIAAYRQAIALRFNLAEAHNNLGAALTLKGHFDDAIAACRQAIALRPDYADAHINLGNALKDIGQADAATVEYRQAISLKPGLPEAHYNLALLLLLKGDYRPAWEEHEWRWKTRNFSSPNRGFSQPLWGGEELNGRTILLHAEQGLGDAIQFVRYASQVAIRGGKVLLECQPPLCRLFECLPGVSRVLAAGEPMPAFDLHCPLLSLPRAFGTQVESIPGPIPYLKADPQLVETWRRRIPNGRQGVKVGLAWAGNFAHPHDQRRSMEMKSLIRLARVEGVRFYSLQKGPAATQAAAQSSALELTDFSEDLTDFAVTAALVANLDLVISVDTAVAHLAGAMGKPVCLLLPFVPDWRWLLQREDSPWYPTMRLLRQTSAGAWDDVIERVATYLVLRAHEGSMA